MRAPQGGAFRACALLKEMGEPRRLQLGGLPDGSLSLRHNGVAALQLACGGTGTTEHLAMFANIVLYLFMRAWLTLPELLVASLMQPSLSVVGDSFFLRISSPFSTVLLFPFFIAFLYCNFLFLLYSNLYSYPFYFSKIKHSQNQSFPFILT